MRPHLTKIWNVNININRIIKNYLKQFEQIHIVVLERTKRYARGGGGHGGGGGGHGGGHGGGGGRGGGFGGGRGGFGGGRGGFGGGRGGFGGGRGGFGHGRGFGRHGFIGGGGFVIPPFRRPFYSYGG